MIDVDERGEQPAPNGPGDRAQLIRDLGGALAVTVPVTVNAPLG
jgi:hypothetical protein